VRYKFEDIAINSIAKKKPTNSDKNTYLGLEHLDSGNLTVTRFGSDVAPIGEKLIMKKGDVLFGKRRAYQKKVAIAPFDGIFSAHGMVLRPKEQVVCKDFFPLFISSDYFLDAAIKISVGSLSPTINWSALKELEFELPPITQQQQLSKILWAATETKNAYKMLLLLTEKLVMSRFVEMFGDPNLALKSIYDICTNITDGDWIESKDQSDNGIRLIQTGNIGDGVFLDKSNKARYISEETFDRLKCSEIFQGDVLISRLPDPIGRACELPELGERMITAVDCTIIRLNKEIMTNEFFIAFTKTVEYKTKIASCSRGATRQRISRKDLENIQILLPPLSLQNQFAEFVKQADKSKFAALKQTKVTTLLYNDINGG